MEWGIIFLIFFTPLALGAVYPWAYGFMEAVAFLLLGLWLLRGVIGKSVVLGARGRERGRVLQWAWVWPFVLLALIFIQVIPLPSGVIRSISPTTYQVYMPIVGGDFRTLSLDRFATWCDLLKILAYLCIFLILVYFPFEDHRRAVKHICLGAMGVGVFVGLLGLIQRFAGAEQIFWLWNPFSKRGRNFYGPFMNPNHFAVYTEMIISLFLGYIAYQIVREGGNKGRGKGIKAWIVDMEKMHIKSILLFFWVLILTVSLFFSLSRGGMVIILNAFLFFVLMVFLRRRRAKGLVVLVIFFCMILFLYLTNLGIEPILKELQSLFRAGEDLSFQSRILVWEDVWRMIKAFPMFGIGLGGFGVIFPRFMTLKGRLGRIVWLYAHNDYFQLWAELGLGGLILLCIGVIVFVIGIIHWVRCEGSPHRGREAWRYLELGCYTAIFCFLVHSMVGYGFYIPANIMLFVVVCGIVMRMQIGGERQKEDIYTYKKKRVSRIWYAILLGIIPVFMITVILGGYGKASYKSIGDTEFREKILKEIPVAGIMPFWNDSPYRHYFLARWHEKNGFDFGNNHEAQRAWFEKAINEIVKAIDLQPSRSLFWERLGYLISYISSFSSDYHYFFPGTDRAFDYQDAFIRAIHFSPNDARLHYRIGTYLWKMGDSSGLSILQQAIRIDPALRWRIERLIKSR